MPQELSGLTELLYAKKNKGHLTVYILGFYKLKQLYSMLCVCNSVCRKAPIITIETDDACYDPNKKQNLPTSAAAIKG